MLTYQTGVQVKATVAHIVTFFTLLKVLFAYSRGNGWLWQVGWVGVLGMKYDAWVCCSGFRAHQTFLEMITQF